MQRALGATSLATPWRERAVGPRGPRGFNLFAPQHPTQRRNAPSSIRARAQAKGWSARSRPRPAAAVPTAIGRPSSSVNLSPTPSATTGNPVVVARSTVAPTPNAIRPKTDRSNTKRSGQRPRSTSVNRYVIMLYLLRLERQIGDQTPVRRSRIFVRLHYH